MFSSIVSGLGSLASSALNYFGTQQTNAQNASNVAATNAENAAAAGANNATQLQIANQNVQMQEDFANNGLSMKIADAAKNGISPLAAIGATDPQYMPVQPVLDTPVAQPAPYTSPLNSMSAGINEAGQNLSRALTATQSPQDKANAALDLAYKSKQNDLLDVQIANAKLSLANAAAPGIPSAFRQMRNADGSISNYPVEGLNPHEGLLNNFLWSLDNKMVPDMTPYNFNSGVPNAIGTWDSK